MDQEYKKRNQEDIKKTFAIDEGPSLNDKIKGLLGMEDPSPRKALAEKIYAQK